MDLDFDRTNVVLFWFWKNGKSFVRYKYFSYICGVERINLLMDMKHKGFVAD